MCKLGCTRAGSTFGFYPVRVLFRFGFTRVGSTLSSIRFGSGLTQPIRFFHTGSRSCRVRFPMRVFFVDVRGGGIFLFWLVV